MPANRYRGVFMRNYTPQYVSFCAQYKNRLPSKTAKKQEGRRFLPEKCVCVGCGSALTRLRVGVYNQPNNILFCRKVSGTWRKIKTGPGSRSNGRSGSCRRCSARYSCWKQTRSAARRGAAHGAAAGCGMERHPAQTAWHARRWQNTPAAASWKPTATACMR